MPNLYNSRILCFKRCMIGMLEPVDALSDSYLACQAQSGETLAIADTGYLDTITRAQTPCEAAAVGVNCAGCVRVQQQV